MNADERASLALQIADELASGQVNETELHRTEIAQAVRSWRVPPFRPGRSIGSGI